MPGKLLIVCPATIGAPEPTVPMRTALPLPVSALMPALATVGNAIDCTRVPPDVYSSMNTPVLALLGAPLPVPTR